MGTLATLRLLYVGPSEERSPFMWIDGQVLAGADWGSSGTDSSLVSDLMADRPARRVSHAGTTWSRGPNYLLVETSVRGWYDDLGRPLVCTMLFDGLLPDTPAELPVDEVLGVLTGHQCPMDADHLRSILRTRQTTLVVPPRIERAVGIGAAAVMIGGIVLGSARLVRRARTWRASRKAARS